MSKLIDKLKIDPKKPLTKSATQPVWKGPETDGVTFSMLSRFICCRERFRLYVVEGLRTKDIFNSKIEYGNMWHECEEALAGNNNWEQVLTDYVRGLLGKYPFNREEVDLWYKKCLVQFPSYVDYWKEHDDVKNRTPLFQEQVFDVPYTLPSGRKVRLRGKWDSGDIIGTGKEGGIYIAENKTKSQIDQRKMTRQLSYDLQSMMYLAALERFDWRTKFDIMSSKSPVNIFNAVQVKGVRYNVVRRSAHKTAESMYKKMTEDIADGRGQEWFSRWKVDVSPEDIKRFKERTFHPLLEQLCEWWECIKFSKNEPFKEYYNCHDNHGIHYQAPFGVYNVLLEGGSSDLDSYIENGDESGLERTDNLYRELT